MLRMAGMVLFMVVSSLDAIPSHEARRGPIGGEGFDQPMPDMLGGESDALGRAGLDRQRIQPERFPAIVEPIEQPEMMAMQMKHRGDAGAFGQRKHDGPARLGPERRCG